MSVRSPRIAATELSRSDDGPRDFDPRRDLPQLPLEALDVDDRFDGHFPDRRLWHGLAVKHALPGRDLGGRLTDRRLWRGIAVEHALPGGDFGGNVPGRRLRRGVAVERALPRCDLGHRVVDRHTVSICCGAVARGSRSGRPLDRTTRLCRRSGQPPIGIVTSLAERGGATLRRQLACGRLAARQPFQLLGKLVETGVDLVQRAARAGALALKFAVFFWAALHFLGALLVAIAVPLPRLRRLPLDVALP